MGDFVHDACSATENDSSSCGTALHAKCKAQKAMSIIGVLAATLALGLVQCCAWLPWYVPGTAAGLGSLCYLVMFAIAAQLYNDETPVSRLAVTLTGM